MNRRVVWITGVLLSILLAGRLAYAQNPGPVYRVGLVLVASPIAQMLGSDPSHPSVNAFFKELRRRGYVEGRNLVFERRSAEGRTDRLEDLLAELLRLKMDVIVTAGNDLPRIAKRLTSEVPIVMATSRSPVEAGLVETLAADRPDALFVANSASNYARRKRIADFAITSRLPAIYPFREMVEAGGLMAYGANVSDLYRRAAGYVDRILKGARPGDLPVEQPTTFEMVINLKTANALGLTIPPSLLLGADEVLQ